MTNYDTESRLRAIAFNAVREAMLVAGRWEKPFTDDDAARADAIFALLHLQDRQEEYEHALLAPVDQSPIDKKVSTVASVLDGEPLIAERVREISTPKASVSKAK